MQLLFAQALADQGLVDPASGVLLGPDGRPLQRGADSGPILVAWSDNGPEMTSGDTREFMALPKADELRAAEAEIAQPTDVVTEQAIELALLVGNSEGPGRPRPRQGVRPGQGRGVDADQVRSPPAGRTAVPAGSLLWGASGAPLGGPP